jgi:glycerophosphoryl diester phosphodiesterase
VSPRWPYPRVIAHRGGGAFAPENTLAAIRAGSARGFRAVEFDVMLAADAVPVLIHDETLERTTSGRGLVAEAGSALLAGLDAGSSFSPEFAGEPVPRYADAASLCIELGVWANVEIKPTPGLERTTGRAVGAMSARLWRAAPLAPLLSSFSADALVAAREAAPGLARGLLVGQVPQDWRECMQRLGCLSLHCDHRHLSEALAQAITDAGHGLLCYTVNDREVARRLSDWGVDAIVTDRLDLIAPDFLAPV